MPYNSEWYQDGAIIHYTLSGEISLDDVASLVDTTLGYFDQSQRTLVHILVDYTDLETYSRDLGEMQRLLRSTLEHPQMGWVISYGDTNPLLHFATKIVTGITQTRLRVFATQDEALRFLSMVDVDLNLGPKYEMAVEE